MNYTYKDYDYPLNLLIELFSIDKLPDYDTVDFLETLDRVLDTLPEPVKAAVILRYRQKMTYREIAAAVHRSESTVGQIVGKGLRLLRHPSRANMLLSKAINGFRQ